MSRITYPLRFTERTNLFKQLKAKHDADAATSVLIPFVTAESIDLIADDKATDFAIVAHNLSKQAEKDAEKFSSERDRMFEPVFDDHKRCVQFLKKLFTSNVHRLGDWGVTVNNESRIEYPSDFQQRTLAIKLFINMHNTFAPGTSPLQPFLDENVIDLVANQTASNNALTAHADYMSRAAISEQQREERDTLFDPVMEHVRQCGAYLMHLFDTKPHKLGDWGFIIDNSPQATRIAKGEINPGQTKVLRNVAVESILANIGAVNLKIYKGIAPIGTPVILDPNQNFTVVRNYGTMTLVNESTTETGQYQGEFNP